MSIYKYLFALVFFAFCFGSILGQQDSVLRLNHQQAIEYALTHNYDYKNAELDVLKAKKRVQETTAMGLPQVSTDFSYQYIPGDVPSLSFGKSDGEGPSQEVLDSIIDPTNIPDFYRLLGDAFGGESKIAEKHSATWNVQVSQLIFSGEYIVGLQTAKTYRMLSGVAYDKSATDTKADISSSYFSCLILKENVGILKENLRIMDTTLLHSGAFLKTGFIDSSSYNSVKLIRTNLENTVITVERQTYQMLSLLKIQLGMEINQELILTDGLDNFINEEELLVLSNSEFVLDNNIDYQMLKVQEQLNGKMVRLEKVKYLPTIAAFYNYQKKIRPGDVDFSIPHMVGLTASWSIFTGGSRNAKLKQAKIELEQAKNTKLQMTQMLRMQYNQALYDLLTSYEKYLLQKESLELAQSIFEDNSIKYKEGVATSDELYDSQSQFLTAQSNYYSTLLELYNSKINIKKALNNL